jgi:hypothetical protein
MGIVPLYTQRVAAGVAQGMSFMAMFLREEAISDPNIYMQYMKHNHTTWHSYIHN